MIIVMKPEATVEDLNAVKDKIKNSGLDYHYHRVHLELLSV